MRPSWDLFRTCFCFLGLCWSRPSSSWCGVVHTMKPLNSWLAQKKFQKPWLFFPELFPRWSRCSNFLIWFKFMCALSPVGRVQCFPIPGCWHAWNPTTCWAKRLFDRRCGSLNCGSVPGGFHMFYRTRFLCVLSHLEKWNPNPWFIKEGQRISFLVDFQKNREHQMFEYIHNTGSQETCGFLPLTSKMQFL